MQNHYNKANSNQTRAAKPSLKSLNGLNGKKTLFGYTINIFNLQKTDVFLGFFILTIVFIALAYVQTRHLLVTRSYTQELKNYEKILIRKKSLEETVSKHQKPFLSENTLAQGWERIKIKDVPIIHFGSRKVSNR